MNIDFNRVFLIIRGVSGSSKTTFGNFLCDKISGSQFEADQFMVKDGEYHFNSKNLGYCHQNCFEGVEKAMAANERFIIISNTLTADWELNPYITLAKQYNYTYFVLVMENRNDTKSVHSVSVDTLKKQAERLKNSIKLI
jgi:predicted kinase